MKKAIVIRERSIEDHLIFVDIGIDDEELDNACDGIEDFNCFDDVCDMFERKLGDKFLGVQRGYFQDYDSVEYEDELEMEDE
jgi:hypothetical protein